MKANVYKKLRMLQGRMEVSKTRISNEGWGNEAAHLVSKTSVFDDVNRH